MFFPLKNWDTSLLDGSRHFSLPLGFLCALTAAQVPHWQAPSASRDVTPESLYKLMCVRRLSVSVALGAITPSNTPYRWLPMHLIISITM